jgi:hypothetical protein
MNDVAFALDVGAHFGQRLSRIRLQKFIYLLDIVGYMYEMLPPADNHRSYNNGPYDAAIQNAVDSLAFRGLVNISDVEKTSGKIHCNYTLTPSGNKWAKSLASRSEFNLRFVAANAVGENIQKLGWKRLVDLVYAEPTYVQKRFSGFGQRIDITDGTQNTSAYLAGLINRFLEIGKQHKLNRGLAVDIFFRYLDNFAKASTEQARSINHTAIPLSQ